MSSIFVGSSAHVVADGPQLPGPINEPGRGAGVGELGLAGKAPGADTVADVVVCNEVGVLFAEDHA